MSSLSIHLFRHQRMITAIMGDQSPGALVRIRRDIMDVGVVNHILLCKAKSLLLIIMTLPTGNSYNLGVEGAVALPALQLCEGLLGRNRTRED